MAVFTTSVTDDVAVLRVSGELDIATQADLLSHATPLLTADARAIRLDLAEVSFIDSSGLGALVRLRQQAIAAGRELVLANPPRPVTRILTLTGLDDLFSTDTDR